MPDFAQRIRERREKLGWSQTKLSVMSGMSQATISRLESGEIAGSIDTLQRLAGAMGMQLSDIVSERTNVGPAPTDWRSIPILSYRQAAVWKVDSVAQPGQHETIMTHLEYSPSTFSLILIDDTNAPKYLRGDVVVIDPNVSPDFGNMVVIADPGGSSIFGQYRDAGINSHGVQVFELHPLNPIYAPKRSDRVPMSVVGTMVEHRSYRKPQ
jgi:transcriptional regulator with XRE-family HTH domain